MLCTVYYVTFDRCMNITIIILKKLKAKKVLGKKKEGGLQAESKVAKTGKREKRNGEGVSA